MNESSEQLLFRLRLGERTAYKALYKDYYKMIKTFIINNSGSEESAKDIFQEVIIVLLRYIRKDDFKLNGKLSTFLYGIARNLWFQRIKSNNKIPVVGIGEDNMNQIKDDISGLEEKVVYEDKHRILSDILDTLSEECKKLIRLYYYKKLPLKEIAKLLDYTDSFIKVKKSRCMKGFKEKANQDSRVNQLKKES